MFRENQKEKSKLRTGWRRWYKAGAGTAKFFANYLNKKERQHTRKCIETEQYDEIATKNKSRIDWLIT